MDSKTKVVESVAAKKTLVGPKGLNMTFMVEDVRHTVSDGVVTPPLSENIPSSLWGYGFVLE